MKVANINTLNYGGAGVVARRVHLALIALKVDSTLVTKYGVKGELPNIVSLRDARLRNFLRKKLSHPLFSYLAKVTKSATEHRNLANRPVGFEMFSPIYTEPNPWLETILADFDIIHLHWINNFIDYSTFFQRYRDKKFVWTLHDMNPITGGCHHSDGCMKFEGDCVLCPQLQNTVNPNYSLTVQKFKIDGLRHLNDDQLVIVTPSEWLSQLSLKSRITGRFKHLVIPNPSIETDVFTTERESVRKNLNLPARQKIVLFVSDNLRNPRKGIDLLFEAIRLIPDKEKIALVGIGHKGSEQKDLNIHYTGSITNTRLLSEYFYSADIFVTPSLAENSPLVVIEALTCGTPVVASNVGGIPDLITVDNGLLSPPAEIKSLARSIEKALFEVAFDRNKIRHGALKYHPLKVATSYLDIYKDLMRI